MTFFAALLIALSALTMAPSQAPITAPSQALTYEAPLVTTSPAPKALQAPSQPLTQALSAPPTQAPSEAPTQAPICEEDMPCWDCHTMGNLICGNEAPQAPTAPRCEEDMPCWDCSTMGNLICGATSPEALENCPADFYLFAGGECVDPSTQAPVNVTEAPTAWDCDTTGATQCTDPNLEDAWESFDATDIDYSDTHPLAYVKTTDAAPKASKGQVIVKSVNLPNVWHVFA